MSPRDVRDTIPHHGSRAPSLTPRRWIDALDATFHCEAPLRRPFGLFQGKPPSGGSRSLQRKCGRIRPAPRPARYPTAQSSREPVIPALRVAPANLDILRLQEAQCRTLDEPPSRPTAVAANSRSRAWTRLACRSLPMSSVYRDKGRDSGRRAGTLAPGCRSAPKHRNGAASSQRLLSPTQNPKDKPKTPNPTIEDPPREDRIKTPV